MTITRVCDPILYLGLLKTIGCCLGLLRMDQNDSIVWYIDIASLSTIFILVNCTKKDLCDNSYHIWGDTWLSVAKTAVFYLIPQICIKFQQNWRDKKISSCLNQFHELKRQMNFLFGSSSACPCRIVGEYWWLSDLFCQNFFLLIRVQLWLTCALHPTLLFLLLLMECWFSN